MALATPFRAPAPVAFRSLTLRSEHLSPCSTMVAPVLLSRGLDPFLGIFTGFFAYYLHETHPRTALPPDERLSVLLRHKWDRFQQKRKEHLRGLDSGLA
ncbi:hypothetical protein Hypma_011671 [Hypsizygus marmoreus]|uniref:Uncharacterized protein n=1 Tax=Hypsizygus marmoreus TaxID=39966 RepID=A0A369JGY2_HYPMA|nr:hypothetical protein Hypma_011671 [Hypsizygus marmoreus]